MNGCAKALLVTLGLLAVVLAVLWAIIGTRPPVETSSAPDATAAWLDCQNFVRQYESGTFGPQSAGEVRQDAERWYVTGTVDALPYACDLSYSGSRVTLRQLAIGGRVLVDNP